MQLNHREQCRKGIKNKLLKDNFLIPNHSNEFIKINRTLLRHLLSFKLSMKHFN